MLKLPSNLYESVKSIPTRTISFTPNELFEKGKLYFKYEEEMDNTSAYTKKIISGYGYKEK